MDLISAISGLVALYGAVISSILLFLRWKENQPDIKVEVDKIPNDTDNLYTEFSDKIKKELMISAKNIGRIPVYMENAGLLLENSAKIHISFCNPNAQEFCDWGGEFDVFELQPGKICHGHIMLKEVAERAKNKGSINGESNGGGAPHSKLWGMQGAAAG
ncbi:MAG: hypothetical protein ABR985_01515 [Methanotrichaceae archaeon]|jgi:hypothetical protein